MDIAVNQDNLALAIGSRGQNIRLASKLVGWDLNIISSEEAEAKEKVDQTEFLGNMMESLGVKEEVAEGLINAGLNTFDDIAYADESVLSGIISDANEMERVKSTAEDAALMEAMGEISAEEEDAESLADLDISDENLLKLSAKAIKNKDDLAELAVDELQDIIEISNEDASALIMKAREHWFN
jgi:N utilization substance protein A